MDAVRKRIYFILHGLPSLGIVYRAVPQNTAYGRQKYGALEKGRIATPFFSLRLFCAFPQFCQRLRKFFRCFRLFPLTADLHEAGKVTFLHGRESKRVLHGLLRRIHMNDLGHMSGLRIPESVFPEYSGSCLIPSVSATPGNSPHSCLLPVPGTLRSFPDGHK